MSRTLLFALFCTSAIACTSAHTSTTATAAVTQPAARPATQPQPVPTLDRSRLRHQLAAARAHNLIRLEAYARAGAFPKNQVQPGTLNVFRDNEGHLCAVANLINLDGHTSLIEETAIDDNFIVLASVTEGPLLDWILTSGFTQEEIGMIQVPYMGEFRGPEPVVDEQQLAAIRAQEVERVRTALLEVHRALSENSQHSLDVAVQRASPGARMAQVSSPKFAQPPR